MYLLCICLFYSNNVLCHRIVKATTTSTSTTGRLDGSNNNGRSKKNSVNDRQVQVINFLAGGIAGTMSSSITAPLEVVKTQLQSSRLANKGNFFSACKDIFKTNGIRGFYRGIQPMLFGIIPTRAIYFWSYTTTKNALNSTSLGSGPLTHLLSAFSAGITSNTLTNPIWLVKTRFQLIADTSAGQTQFKSYGEVIRAIYKESGFKGFFKGLSASYVGCTEGAIQWIVYEKLKKALELEQKDKNKKITPSQYARASSAAKFVAILMTYPHEVVRTRLREQGSKYTGFVHALRTIAKEEGMKGLYGGVGLHLIRSVPNAAIMFVTFELVSNYLQNQIDSGLPLIPTISNKKSNT